MPEINLPHQMTFDIIFYVRSKYQLMSAPESLNRRIERVKESFLRPYKISMPIYKTAKHRKKSHFDSVVLLVLMKYWTFITF
ncbi:hypothetical protein BpHYR1_038183 [Brachionus plicatilis]|uniref:Uncharacterized protein n=1 Tax=Brachionus plicatilis TaxID=10195 RepID=A0A3M7RAJ0_BRAPC|nr:hypothetical protein BpHYR1_038183 [Brachionus plicatilis]